jgi:hypothetical protein
MTTQLLWAEKGDLDEEPVMVHVQEEWPAELRNPSIVTGTYVLVILPINSQIPRELDLGLYPSWPLLRDFHLRLDRCAGSQAESPEDHFFDFFS